MNYYQNTWYLNLNGSATKIEKQIQQYKHYSLKTLLYCSCQPNKSTIQRDFHEWYFRELSVIIVSYLIT